MNGIKRIKINNSTMEKAKTFEDFLITEGIDLHSLDDLTDDQEQEVFDATPNSGDDRRRFRASIYVDVMVPKTDNLEDDRKLAVKLVDKDRKRLISANSYVGGAAYMPFGRLPDQKELDKI